MLCTIGDLHLAFGSDKPMDVFGPLWENHTEKLLSGFSKLGDGDVCVICGDLTWGMDMQNCMEDFHFIDRLPGKKIILKGNHDFWWSTATRARKLFEENEIKTIEILNNNCFFYEGTAICGTRGWANQNTEHDRKIMKREIMRLKTSLEAAGDTDRKICFLHYPPIFGGAVNREMIDVMTEYGVRECYYGHIHGAGRALAFEGEAGGITYRLISADHVNFSPVKIM